MEGAGSPDNPVPGPEGQLYVSSGAVGNGVEVDAVFGAPLPEDAFGGAPIPEDAFGTADEHALNGAMDYVRWLSRVALVDDMMCTFCVAPSCVYNAMMKHCSHTLLRSRRRHQMTTHVPLPCATCSASASRTRSSWR